MNLAWALAFASRPVSGVAAAADRDQAAILRNAVGTLCRLNPWLDDLLDVQAFRVVNRKTNSELNIISSDTASSYGLLVDFIVCDELTHWAGTRGEQLWISLLSAAAKKEHCVLSVIANAGFRQHFSYGVYEAVRDDPAWYVHCLRGPVASWITDKMLDEQRRLLPEQAYSRLWLNQFAEGSGDSAFLDTDIAAVFIDDLLPLSLEV